MIIEGGNLALCRLIADLHIFLFIGVAVIMKAESFSLIVWTSPRQIFSYLVASWSRLLRFFANIRPLSEMPGERCLTIQHLYQKKTHFWGQTFFWLQSWLITSSVDNNNDNNIFLSNLFLMSQTACKNDQLSFHINEYFCIIFIVFCNTNLCEALIRLCCARLPYFSDFEGNFDHKKVKHWLNNYYNFCPNLPSM